jgi:hypothetical protein
MFANLGTRSDSVSAPRQVPPQLREWFRSFALFLKEQRLGTHCTLCAQNVIARDAWRHWGECVGKSGRKDFASGAVKPLTIRARVELSAGRAEWFRQFADVGQHFCLGIHCQTCQADLIGKNADTDRTFEMSCGCRQFIGPNRDYREPTTAESYYSALSKP